MPTGPTAAETRPGTTRAAELTAAVLPPGAKFGRYTIVRPIGSGGMGAVYEATQDSPRRSVALKVIRGRWLSAQLLRRFEHESQVLGRLQHPGIAQVYEAGSVTDERGDVVPFFAMELIKGVPLNEYAAGRGLGTRERLELVARICDAVYHAHQKGVIHRDLKPGNILVDESGQPKVLDFGVARANATDAAAGGSGRASGGAPAAVEVGLLPVRQGRAVRTVAVTGTLFGEEEATIASKLSGRIESVLLDVGDAAPSGAVPARVEPRD